MTIPKAADAEFILNHYLYGQAKTPTDLTDDDLIRAANVTTTVTVTGSSYVAKLGRFALPSTFEIVEAFFNAGSSLPAKYDAQGNLTFYTEIELRPLLGTTQATVEIEQYKYADALGDYAERTLIWNSTVFEIADTSQFWVLPSGDKEIRNFAVIPFDSPSTNGADNFDLTSDSIPTQIANYAYLSSRLDPFEIGRRVDVMITDDVQRKTYTLTDFNRDTQTEGTWSTPGFLSAFEAVANLVSGLHNSNIVSPHDVSGRPVVYGTVGEDTLVFTDAQQPFYNVGSVPGLSFVGGAGTDTVDYTTAAFPTKILINNGFATVTGGQGKIDRMYGIEVVKATPYRDTLTIVGNIAFETLLTIDANGGQSANPEDTIDASRARSVTVYIDSATGEGYVRSNDTGGEITLRGFHTGVIGSAYDDTITDYNSGFKMISGGEGNDVISIEDSSDAGLLEGDAGNDDITGGPGNDMIFGGGAVAYDGNESVWHRGDIMDGGGGNDVITSLSQFDTVRGGEGDDYISVANGHALAEYGGTLIDGGSGNDIIDIMPKPETTYYHQNANGSFSKTNAASVNFAADSGNDKVIGEFFTDYAAGQLNPHGGVDIRLDSIDVGDLKVIWDVTFDQSGSFIGHGDLVVLNTVTGDSIFLENVYGQMYAYYSGGGNFWVPSVYINGLNLGHYIEDIPIEAGPTSAYDVAGQPLARSSGGSNSSAGGSGDDLILGGVGDDELSGGDGDDVFVDVFGANTIDGGAGHDTLRLRGQPGDFTVTIVDVATTRVESRANGANSYLLTSVEAIEFSRDTTSLDIGTLRGGYFGTPDADNFSGDGAANTIFGGDSSDTLAGAGGDDLLYGDNGDDILDGGAGANRLSGGRGEDTFVVTASVVQQTVILDAVSQYVADGAGERVDYLGTNTLLFAGATESSLTFSRAGARHQDLIITSSAGATVVLQDQFASALSGFTVTTLLLGNAASPIDASYLLSGGQFLAATSDADTQIGTQLDDEFAGSLGDDMMIGLDGADRYLVGGGNGQDVIDDRGLGSDRLIRPTWKGPGAEPPRVSVDTLVLDFWITPDDLILSQDGNDLIIRIVGESGSTRVVGQFANASFVSDISPDQYAYFDIDPNDPLSQSGVEAFEFGNGTIWNRADIETRVDSGSDVVGTELADTIVASSTARIAALDGDDIVTGSASNDLLDGGSGNDQLAGDAGADILIGGLGADIFQFTAISDSPAQAAVLDTIRDFAHAHGDLIDLSPIDADASQAGNQAFAFIGSAAFSGQPGQLRATHGTTDWLVEGDSDGDGTADIAFTVASSTLVAADFVL